MKNNNNINDNRVLVYRVSIALALIYWLTQQIIPLALMPATLLGYSLPFTLISIALLSVSADAYRNNDYVLAFYFLASFALSVNMGGV